MIIISHVVALSNNRVIGVNNDLPWSLKKDLAHFRAYTTNKIIIMGIHWGKNWVSNMEKDFYKEDKFAKSLIDSGCNIVFGSGAHHIVPVPYTFYNKGIIIYGLGDLSGDFKVKPLYNSLDSLSLIYDTNTNSIQEIKLTKEFNGTKCGIPILKMF